jgi:hypothetical protein
MADQKSLPLWRLVIGWVLVSVLAGIWIACLVEGEVVVGKRGKMHYTRAGDPVAYWLSMLWYAAVTGYIAYYLARTKRSAVVTPELDRTPRDWMGNPLDPK